ncbi:hypothetical protein U9M48_032096, partial [Paspalum notatum var. saurae]
MKLCLLAPSNSPLGSEFGRLGLLESASFLCGWLLITDVGPRIAWQKGGCPNSRLALCVTKLLNQSTMSSLHEVWTLVLQRFNHVVRPPELDSHLNSWWVRAASSLPKDMRKGFNSLVILVSWELWKHRNAYIFENIRPNAQLVVQTVATEGHLWCLAGAKALQYLVL